MKSPTITFNPITTKLQKVPRSSSSILGELEKDSIFTFSGKTALALLLQYYRASGALRNKSDQIIVPQWLGYWVYMTMHKTCFPTTTMNSQVRGVLLYHQWGFPQKIEEIANFCKENNLFCIEDCAHSFSGYYNKQRLGTFGDAAIFSFAKFFPCVVGGAVYSTNDAIKQFVEGALKKHNPQLERAAFINRLSLDAHPTEKNRIALEQFYAVYDKTMRCQPYAANSVREQLKKNALERRRAIYETLRKALVRFDTHQLYADGILPWVFPIFIKKENAEKIARQLQAKGIECGLYYFDVRRNMLDADFRQCLAIPCHQDVPPAVVEYMISVIEKNS